jgi:heme-degrading monooxygenase HmoA
MFARVVTAQAEAEGFDSVTRLAREQLPVARQQPGFRGFYLLSDPGSGKLMSISLWETKEHMQAGEAQAAQLRGQAAPAEALTGLRVDGYEVTMSA